MTTKGNYGPMVAILNSDPLKPQHFKTHKQIKQFQHFFYITLFIYLKENNLFIKNLQTFSNYNAKHAIKYDTQVFCVLHRTPTWLYECVTVTKFPAVLCCSPLPTWVFGTSGVFRRQLHSNVENRGSCWQLHGPYRDSWQQCGNLQHHQQQLYLSLPVWANIPPVCAGLQPRWQQSSRTSSQLHHL